MTTLAERNKALVVEYLVAFRANTEAGRLLYPKPDEAVVKHEVVLADDRWVSVLLTRRAVTNKREDYENVYAMFFEIVDGKIQTEVELLDFRVAAEKFDLSVLECS